MMLVVGSIITLVCALLVGSMLPGIERKVQARIQQRVGPPITTPGFWSILKFIYKKQRKVRSPSPGVYQALVVVSLTSVAFILLFSSPYWWGILGFGTLFALISLLKVEEVAYMFMASLSKTVLSLNMPFADDVKGTAIVDVKRRSMEEMSSVRALKMITVGSFPFYLALFLPFVAAASISIDSVVFMQNPVYQGVIEQGNAVDLVAMFSSLDPVLLSLSGLIAAFVYFIGYNMVLNNRPFDIVKPKVDVVEGPLMEYMAVWRALAYLLLGLLAFTLSSLFVMLFIGIPLDVRVPALFIIHLALVLVLPVFAAILRAFSPVLTFKQIYDISLWATAIALAGIILRYMGV